MSRLRERALDLGFALLSGLWLGAAAVLGRLTGARARSLLRVGGLGALHATLFLGLAFLCMQRVLPGEVAVQSSAVGTGGVDARDREVGLHLNLRWLQAWHRLDARLHVPGFGLAAGPGTPAKTLKEFLVWAKANPTKASFGTPGAGTNMHFLGVQLAKDAQVEMTHIPYRGGAPAMVDVIGGNLPTLFTTLPNLLQQYKGGKLRILGFSGDKRMAALPEIPTFKEQGFPNLTMSEMFVFMAKAQTPPALQKELASALSAAVRSKDVILALEKAEFEPLVMEQAAISKRLQEETAHWAAVVRSTGYKAED